MATTRPPAKFWDLGRNLNLFSSPLEPEGSRPTLTWSAINSNPRITVFTRTSTHNNKRGAIHAPMNMETFYIFLGILENTAKHDGPVSSYIENFNVKRDAQGNTSQPAERIKVSTTHIGKDDNGVVYLMIEHVDEKVPKVKFPIRVSDWSRIYKEDGTQLTEAEGSKLAVFALARSLRNVYSRLMDFEERKVAPRNNGDSGNGNGNGYKHIDDDIPF